MQAIMQNFHLYQKILNKEKNLLKVDLEKWKGLLNVAFVEMKSFSLKGTLKKCIQSDNVLAVD